MYTVLGMTPMEYVRDMVSISSEKKLLYNCIFNIFKIDIEDDINRKLSGQVNIENLYTHIRQFHIFVSKSDKIRSLKCNALKLFMILFK